MPDDLLFTKISPPRLHASLVQRAELFARLNQGLGAKVTLVTAPTGSGKTTLASQWLAEQRLQAAWVTLDEGDNDPVRFWRYVISAFRHLNDEVGKEALATLRVVQQPPIDPLLTSLINDLALFPAQVVLILDDLYTLSSGEVLGALLFLIEHQPANLHILLLARSAPDLPLALLRARGELNELGAADLRFSHSEIEVFTRLALPFELSPTAIQRLAEKTEGWAAGVRLALLAMQGKNLPGASPAEMEQFLEAFSGEHRFVYEYLRGEVLEKLPEPVRTFLIQTSLFNRICAPLCNVLTGRSDSAGMLEQLEMANIFVTPLGTRDGTAWYRYQALFAGAMRHYAARSLGETAVRDLYEKASAWFDRNGLLDEAIEAALDGGLVECALQLIEKFILQTSVNEVRTLCRWCSRIPTEAIRQHPLVAFHYGLALLFTLDRYAPATAAVIEPLLQAAEDAWTAEGNRARTGQVYAVREMVAWWQGDPKTGFEHAHRAFALLPEEELIWRSMALLGLGNEALADGSLELARNHLMEAQALSGAAQNIHAVLGAMQGLAEIEYQQGEMDRASALWQEVLAEAVGGEEMLDDQSIAWLGLARIAYERNDLPTAEEQAALAFELGSRRANEDVWAPANILQALIHRARGETASAQARIHSLLGRVKHPDLLREIWVNLALLALEAGDLDAARRCQDALLALPEPPFFTHLLRSSLVSAHILLAEGKTKEGLQLVQPLRAKAQAQCRVRAQIELLCLESRLQADLLPASGRLEALRDPAQAYQPLAAALALAQPRGFRRIFQDQGDGFMRLLQDGLGRLSRQSLKLYATGLLHAYPGRHTVQAEDETGRPLLVEPLSPQEIRVLRLMTAGRSNPEIAAELVVSINTVKTQVQSIYRKLNINSRSEARDAARELNLL